MAPLLSLRLTVDYPEKPGVLRDFSLEIERGEIMGLVGESGCGKSTLALAILRLLHLKRGRAEGKVVLNGKDLMQVSEPEMRSLRGREIGLVLQSPLSSLNPALRIASQLKEAWRVHARGTAAEEQQAIAQALKEVALPGDAQFLKRYPSQLSVGQAQRVLIAMATIHRPSLLIADEPTSALDLLTQADILELFRDLSRRLGTGILFISHDLLSVAKIAHRLAVMRDGQIVECGATATVFCNPSRAYTRQLVNALPVKPEFKANAAGAS